MKRIIIPIAVTLALLTIVGCPITPMQQWVAPQDMPFADKKRIHNQCESESRAKLPFLLTQHQMVRLGEMFDDCMMEHGFVSKYQL